MTSKRNLYPVPGKNKHSTLSFSETQPSTTEFSFPRPARDETKSHNYWQCSSCCFWHLQVFRLLFVSRHHPTSSWQRLHFVRKRRGCVMSTCSARWPFPKQCVSLHNERWQRSQRGSLGSGESCRVVSPSGQRVPFSIWRFWFGLFPGNCTFMGCNFGWHRFIFRHDSRWVLFDV